MRAAACWCRHDLHSRVGKMITLCRDEQRRHVRRGQQEIWQSFTLHRSSGLPGHGFGALLVLDEIRLPPGESTEPHRGDEAETVTYLYKGALSHEDSTGSSGVIHPGEFQRMSTGYRIRHRETAVSLSDPAHVFRIALRPSQVGLELAYEQRRFTVAQRRNTLCAIASPDGRKGSLRIHQDALIFSSILDPGMHLIHELVPTRCAWLHIVCGTGTLNGTVLTCGDGVGLTDEPSFSLTVQKSTEILLVDLAQCDQDSTTG